MRCVLFRALETGSEVRRASTMHGVLAVLRLINGRMTYHRRVLVTSPPPHPPTHTLATPSPEQRTSPPPPARLPHSSPRTPSSPASAANSSSSPRCLHPTPSSQPPHPPSPSNSTQDTPQTTLVPLPSTLTSRSGFSPAIASSSSTNRSRTTSGPRGWLRGSSLTRSVGLLRRELEGKVGGSGEASGDDDNGVSDESDGISGPRSSSATKVRCHERWHGCSCYVQTLTQIFKTTQKPPVHATSRPLFTTTLF